MSSGIKVVIIIVYFENAHFLHAGQGCAVVVWWLLLWTVNLEVPGSNPRWVPVFYKPDQLIDCTGFTRAFIP